MFGSPAAKLCSLVYRQNACSEFSAWVRAAKSCLQQYQTLRQSSPAGRRDGGRFDSDGPTVLVTFRMFCCANDLNYKH
jgi:hypothetical protein